MKKEMEISARTKEEAIAEAVEKLGAPNEAALVITVLHEGRKGFLGFGTVPATIHAVYQIPDAPAAERPDRDRRPPRPRARQAGPRRAPETPRERPAEPAPAAPAPRPVETLDPETAGESERTAYRFIRRVAEDIGVGGAEVTMRKGRNDDTVIAVNGEGAGALIGHHGDTLDALQYLANLAANRRKEGERRAFVRITVDAQDYRAKREEALRSLARRKAAQVLRDKRSVMLEPMNPYERRIIHSEIQGVEGVSTNSIGVENHRRVVVFLETEGAPVGAGPAPRSEAPARSAPERRRRSGRRSRRPSSDLLSSGTRRMQPSIFEGEEDKDPFDIDLSAATYQGDDEEDAKAGETPAEAEPAAPDEGLGDVPAAGDGDRPDGDLPV